MEAPVFQFVLMASCPVTGVHWKEPGSILYASFFQLFIHIDKISLKPSLGWTAPALSFASYERYSSLFVIFVSLHRTLSSTVMSLLYWGACNCTWYCRCGLRSAEQRGRLTTFLNLLATNVMQLWKYGKSKFIYEASEGTKITFQVIPYLLSIFCNILFYYGLMLNKGFRIQHNMKDSTKNVRKVSYGFYVYRIMQAYC